MAAGPATRKLAREWGVDLGKVSGTGPKGRVAPEDVKEYIKGLSQGGGGGRPAATALPDFEHWGAVEYKPFDSIRRKTAEQMHLSWSHGAACHPARSSPT